MTSFLTRDLWPFDLWPWPSGGYKIYPRHITWPSFIKILQREEGEKWLTNSLLTTDYSLLTTDQHNHSIGWAMPPKKSLYLIHWNRQHERIPAGLSDNRSKQCLYLTSNQLNEGKEKRQVPEVERLTGNSWGASSVHKPNDRIHAVAYGCA